MEYDVHITRGADNVNSTVVRADGHDKACELAKGWAASLGLAPDDKVVLAIKLPDGRFRTFNRNDF